MAVRRLPNGRWEASYGDPTVRNAPRSAATRATSGNGKFGCVRWQTGLADLRAPSAGAQRVSHATTPSQERGQVVTTIRKVNSG